MRFVPAILLLSVGFGRGADYYVATTGNDTTGDGSAGTPWATCGKAKTVAAAGDTVHVASGFYGERVTLTADGTMGNPISFVGPSDRSATNWGFVLDGANYIIIGWFNISNTVGAPYASPDFYSGCGIDNEGHHNSIVSNTVHHCAGTGIFSYDKASVGIYATNTLIQGNVCYSNVAAGMVLRLGTDGTVRWNEVYGTYATNQFTSNIYADADGIQVFGQRLLIESNNVHGLWWSPTDPYNFSAGTHTDGLQTWYYDAGDATSWGIQDSTIRDNILDCASASSCMMIQCCTNTVFYNNIFRAHRPVIVTSQTVAPGGVSFYNNDFILKSNSVFQVSLGDTAGLTIADMHGMVFSNNLFVADCAVANNMVAVATSTAVTGGYNLFFETSGAAGCSGYAFAVTDVRNVNPLVTDAFGSSVDYTIASGSPAKNAGVAIPSFSTDIRGTARPQGAAWDIGAYEYISPPLPPPPVVGFHVKRIIARKVYAR